MGAGSAKGLQQEDDEDADNFSTTSSDHWGNDDNSTSDDNTKKDNNNRNQSKKTFADVSSPETSGDKSGGGGGGGENGGTADDNKKESKKKFNLHFSTKKDDPDKVDDYVDDPDDDKKNNKKDADKKKDDKKKDDKKTGFKFFGWRNKKGGSGDEEKDVELDKDIDDLEKTFDSLGIVGKNMWGEDPGPKPRKEAVDDLELLEPMRKRKNVRVRGTRGMNGVVAGGNEMMNGGRNSSEGGGSSGSRRTFKYSWETEQENHSTKNEDDEWEYKAVVIEGFDIDKFRKANKREQMFDSTSLPNAVGGDNTFDGMGTRSPLRYDQNEQQILAAIERDYTFN